MFTLILGDPILLVLMGIWQKLLGSWERLWDIHIKVNPIPKCTGVKDLVVLIRCIS